MRSNYVVQSSSTAAAVHDQAPTQRWDQARSPAIALPKSTDRVVDHDDLGASRGIFAAVLLGSVIWAALGWGAMTLFALWGS